MNLHKWIQYLLKILVFVKVNNKLDQTYNESRNRLSSAISGTPTEDSENTTVVSLTQKERKFTFASKLLDFISFTLIIVINIIFWIRTSQVCYTSDFAHGFTAVSNMFTTLFTTLGFVFLVSGILMALSLKKYYYDFYVEYGKLVWIATFSLALPLFLRGLNSNMYKNNTNYYNYYSRHFAVVNSLYVTLSSIVPIVAQMGSLIFGAKHHYAKIKSNQNNP